MTFPIALADYIAKSCGLPSLYIGEFNGLEIKYIWIIANADTWGHILYSSVVVCSNKWIRGFNQGSGLRGNSHFVELNEYEDSVAMLCRQYSDFPSARNVLDGYMFIGGFFERGRFVPLHIDNPGASHALESVQLDSAFEKTHKIIHEKSEQNFDVISQALQTIEYRTAFIDFLSYITILGLSGVFEETDAPHDLEYILEIEIGIYKYIFAKTRRWFRGIKIYLGEAKTSVIELNPPAINWDETLTKLQDTTAHGFQARLYLYQKSGVTEAKVKDFTKSNEQIPHWNVLRRLIEILNQEE